MQADQNQADIAARPRRRLRSIVGVTAVVVGLLLLAGIGAYYGLGLYSYTQLDNLNASIQGPVSLPPSPVALSETYLDDSTTPASLAAVELTSYEEQQTSPQAVVADAVSQVEGEAPAASQVEREAPALSPFNDAISPPELPESAEATKPVPRNTSVLITGYGSMYPGYQMHPKYWHQPLWAGADPYSHDVIQRPDGYRPVLSSYSILKGTETHAQRIRIPIIGVDSVIEDLQIIDLGDSKWYETPKNVVGRIPNTAKPGELGNGWFFGHLESPIKGEGSVFRRLVEIATHLTDGDPVYVSVLTGEADYLYQVVSSQVIHQDDFRLYGADDATITLVTCSNRPFYNYRQLVTAKLVGVKN